MYKYTLQIVLTLSGSSQNVKFIRLPIQESLVSSSWSYILAPCISNKIEFVSTHTQTADSETLV